MKKPVSLAERRAEPRHRAKLSVELIRGDTVPLRSQTVGLSMGGLHLKCDRLKAQLLAPPDIGVGRQFTTRVVLSAPGMKTRALTSSAIVKSVVKTGQDQYRVGLHFERIFGKGRDLLGTYISQLR